MLQLLTMLNRLLHVALTQVRPSRPWPTLGDLGTASRKRLSTPRMTQTIHALATNEDAR